MPDKDETQPHKRVKKPAEGDWEAENDPTRSDRPFGRPQRGADPAGERPVYTTCDHLCARCDNKCTKMRFHIIHACDTHRIFKHPDDIF